MKNLVVGIFVLLVGITGPQRGSSGRLDGLWALGMLAILAYLLQQLVRSMRLSAIAGWLAAGLLLGASSLQIVRPGERAVLQLVYLLSAFWVGFQSSIHLSWNRQLPWKLPLAIGLATAIVALLVAVVFSLAFGLPWWLALLLAVLASFWGIFSVMPTHEQRGALPLGVVGTGCSLLLLSGLLVLVEVRGVLDESVLPLIGYLWLSLITGVLTTRLVQRGGLLNTPASIEIAPLLGLSLCAVFLIQQLRLYPLLCGFGAGLALTHQQPLVQRLRSLLRPVQPFVFLLFFALLGATVDLGLLWPPASGMLEILSLGLLGALLMRGLGMASFYYLGSPDRLARSSLSWLILPRGALLFELIYHPQHSLLEFLGPAAARLLQQVALADILVNLLFFSSLSLVLQRLFPIRSPSASGEEAAVPEMSPSP